MIHFFRRIRQKLITEGKLSRYLIYAIGEIALVMIGILLALQVNNWNQQRLNKVKASELISQLQKDIKADIFQLSETLKVVDSKERLLTSILSQNTAAIEYIDDLYSGGRFNLFTSRMQAPPNVRDYTYKEMTSTGSLGLIENATLKENIQDYYRYADNRIYAIGEKFSEWPRILSEHMPAEGNLHADFPRPDNGYPGQEINDVINSLRSQQEVLRPTINAEIQYNDKVKVSYKRLLEKARLLLDELENQLN